ncbi:MAG: hypothetical protein WC101_02780 [Candidatus Gracilibacteria bacterium]
MATPKKTPKQLEIEAEKKSRLTEYKDEVWSQKKAIKSDLKKANKLKKPTNH